MDVNDTGAPIYRKTIFLDSNYIIYLSLFIELCLVMAEEPTASAILNSETLAGHGLEKKILEMDRLSDGKKLFDYLTAEAQSGSEIVSSRFCELEFLSLLLERRADKNLLTAGVPFRLRSKKHGLLYLHSLEPSDYSDVTDEYERLKGKVSEYGIDMKILEETGNYHSQIVETAKIIMGNIMIDVPDAIVYSASVTAEADEFLTTDETLKLIANKLRNPSEEPWSSIASAIVHKLQEQNISTGEASTRIPFNLPEGKKV